MDAKVSQGVTTVVAGNCGLSAAPDTLADPASPPEYGLGPSPHGPFPLASTYFAKLESKPPQTNYALLIGHLALRCAAVPDRSRPATPAEISRMKELLAEAMREGALGYSTGLEYPGQRASPTAEIVELAKVAAAHGGLYATHMRDEADKVIDAVKEAILIGRTAGLPLVISHHKCAGTTNYGRTRETLELIAEAMANAPPHAPVSLDVYPYTASSSIFLPEFAAISEEIRIIRSKPFPELSGKLVSHLVTSHPDFRSLTFAQAAEKLAPGIAVYHDMSEDDVRRVLAFPRSMIGSDGMHSPRPHPRLWGSFPRVLGHYARDRRLFTLEEAVHKMTGLPARTFGFEGRGELREGCHADLVLLDPETVGDAATFEDPVRASEGIAMVLVNGRVAWEGGRAVERPGRRLARTVSAPPGALL
ncbi:N-acyl-D-amino-acid deacylase [Hyaloraphidium curvatum]|nr:N-acyl-D-amino-acid deacylase [Hyaloraphidium curvatum]